MSRLLKLALTNFIVSFATSGVIATFLITPLYRAGFGDAMRSPDDAGGLPLMALGFGISALGTAMIFTQLNHTRDDIANGISVGLLAFVLSATEYLKLVGWSTLPVTETILSGLVSALGPLFGAIAMGVVESRLHR